MIAHPLLVAVLVADGLALLLLGIALPTALQVVLRWAPGQSSAAQLRLEAHAERAAIAVRAATGVLLAGTVLLVLAITSVLPSLVPGAMCGTGVLQATGGLGGRALALCCAALGLLAAWHWVERLNRSEPHAPLTTAAARALLLASPVVVLGVVDTARALWRLDVQKPVDCCAAVYDAASPALQAGAQTPTDRWWLWASSAGGAALIALGLRAQRRRTAVSVGVARALAAVALVSTPMAAVALVRVLAPYHYQVLHHHCPWCLFSTDHYAIGFPLFGALAVVALEGVAALVAATFARQGSPVAPAARQRYRRAAQRVVIAVALFWVLAGLPALIWRLRFGTWISG